MKHLEEHQIQGNRNDQDVLMYYTTTGTNFAKFMFHPTFFSPILLKTHSCYVKYHFRVDDVELDGFRSCFGYNTCFI
jgi:hypothetical protein